MNKLFITLYDFFERRRALLCTVLAVLVAAMGAAALQLRFSENITGFFPDGERKAAAAFSNLKIKDKKIENYQIVSATLWNCNPMDDMGQRGPVEQALIGVPVPDIKNPVNVGRLVRAYDP